uniref:hypothetical protein n=1 Tax=Wolbachia endosymbiont of Mansonella perstans TaxID=229526 RepID=UPI001CE223DF|nr:hypothetical protein [Wolbachia endosymbiont of Mansonella perstans]
MGKEDTLVLPVTGEVINEHINKHTDARQPHLVQDWRALVSYRAPSTNYNLSASADSG